jgi:glycosyltransferase involved in cell wall biosynthesis
VKISIVIPCRNEEECIPLFMAEIAKIEALISAATFELIFVDDGSADKTLDVLRQLSKNKKAKYISFSRNFGKEAAMLAGLKASTGDYVAIMDADLQDPPSLLPEMFDAVTKEGFDCAAALRSTRKGEPVIRSFFAKVYYKILNKLTEIKVRDGARDFRLMSRQMVNAILSLAEYNRFSKGLFPWVGFKTKWITYEHVNRAAGKTNWNFWSLFVYSLDGITAFSVKPLALASFFGFIFCLLAFLGILFIIIRWLIYGDPVAGWASTVTIVLFVGGIQLFCTGILGQYLAKSYLETKQRPIYIVKEEDKGDCNENQSQ